MSFADWSKKLTPTFMLEKIFRLVFHSKSPNPIQTPHFSVEYKSEGFGDITIIDKKRKIGLDYGQPIFKSIVKLALSLTLISLFSIHFFALNFLIFLVASFFYFYKNPGKNTKKYLISLISIIILLILLNSFWLQGFFSNKMFSAIDSSHENFFSPKMSKDIPAVAKIIGMYGFWRENAYSTPYQQFPYAITALGLIILVILMLTSYFLSDDKNSKFFYCLFWLGLILGTGISHPYTKPFFDFLFNYLAFFNGFRDSHKFVSLIALSYAYLIPLAITFLKPKLNKILYYITIIILIVFILFYTYPLIGLGNQIKPVNYPESYYNINNYLETQGINESTNEGISRHILYLPYQTYLTYSWTINSSSDGRIAVPINQIIKKPVIIGPDKYGAGDELMNSISICLSEKSLSCLEKNNIQYILKDKCAYFPDSYEWITNSGINSSASLVYPTDCIDVYKINPKTSIQETKTPLRFILGVLISLITIIALIYYRLKYNNKA